VSFVNGVLQEVRSNGSWVTSYQTWVKDRLGPTPAPPQPTYSN